MIDYEDISQSLQTQLEQMARTNKYGLDAPTLYFRLCSSNGDSEKLAFLYGISESLISAIRKLNKEV